MSFLMLESGIQEQSGKLSTLTLKIKVTTPKSRAFLRGQMETYIPGMKQIAVKLFEVSRGNEASTDGQTDSGIT